jgi:signal-transduction protein with cAMP-binding, CBS, and nucleotidyltransferase domain
VLLFKEYSAGDLGPLLVHLQVQKFQRGTVLYDFNSPSDYLYIIRQGEIEV